MYNDKKVIVSLTSWTERISTVHNTIYSLLNQEVIPDSIELNLSLVEFENKFDSLPLELLELLQKHNNVKINWCNGNDKTFKKIIPTLKKYYGESYYLLSVDDDWIYKKTYIKSILNKFIELNCDKLCFANKKTAGGFEIFRSEIFQKDLWEKLSKNVINYGLDDLYYQYYITSKGGNICCLDEDERQKHIEKK